MLETAFWQFLKSYKRACVVFSAALGARLVLFFVFAYLQGISVFWDSAEDIRTYGTLAKHIVQFGSFISQNGVTPESWFTPGYPAFLAFFWYVWHSWIPAVLAQIILASLSAVFVYVIGRDYFSEKAGFTAGILFALEPTSVFLSAFLWSETVFLFLLLLFIVFFLRYITAVDAAEIKRNAVLAGVFLASATYMRQITFLLPVACGVFLTAIFVLMRASVTKRHAASFFLFLLVSVGFVAPWMGRNKMIFDSWSLAAGSSMVVYFFDALPFAYYRNADSKLAYLVGAEDVEEPAGYVWPRSQSGVFNDETGLGLYYEDLIIERTKAIILEHPFEYVIFHGISGFGGFLFQDTWRGILRRGGFVLEGRGFTEAVLHGDIRKMRDWFIRGGALWFGVGIAGHIFFTAVSIAMIIGGVLLAVSGDRNKQIVALFLVVLFLYFALITGPASYRDRYRYPVFPAMALLAVAGWQYGMDRMRAKTGGKK